MSGWIDGGTVTDCRPRFDISQSIFSRDKLLVGEYVVLFRGFREMFTEQIPAGEHDVRIIRHGRDGEIRERKTLGTDHAFLQKFDTGGHRRSDRTAYTDDCNSEFSLCHKRSVSLPHVAKART